MTSYERLFRTTEEQVEPVEAHVTGEIPPWLNGSYIRNGPGVFDVKDFTMNHWCDGFGVIYKFEIHNGKVTFSKRIIQSDAYKKMLSVGRPVYTELGTKAYTDTNKNIFQKMVAHVVPELTDNVFANLFQFGNSIYLSTESCFMRVLEPENLSTKKKVDISQSVNLNRMCSHVYQDHDGTGYTLGSSFTNNFKTQIIKIPAGGNSAKDAYSDAHSICTIPNRSSKHSVYTHSFGLSERFIIYIEQPLFINNMKLVTSQVKGRSLMECMDWNPNESTRFILIEKESGKTIPVVYESESPFFFLHIVNCYEDKDEVIVDVISHASPEVLKCLYLENLRKGGVGLKDQSSCWRYILPLTDNFMDLPEGENLIKSDERASARRDGNKIIIKGTQLYEPHYDMTTINRNYLGRKYKYFYASGLFGETKYAGCILKVNTETGEAITWKESEEAVPGEAAFVPRPGSTDEDDGVLLAGVTNLKSGKKDYLVILDAKNLNELARAETDVHVPHLIHSLFLPSNSS